VASTDLYDALEEFFEVCKQALADTPGGLPECAYISEGPPAWDSCPCLIVYAAGPTVGDTLPLQPTLQPLHRIALARQVNIVAMTALALRCSPLIHDDGETLPTPDEHAAAAREINADSWALWNHLRHAKKTGALFPPREREFSLEPSVSLNPEGGAAGCAVTIRVELDGYDPA
jgi:hypothetical protein